MVCQRDQERAGKFQLHHIVLHWLGRLLRPTKLCCKWLFALAFCPRCSRVQEKAGALLTEMWDVGVPTNMAGNISLNVLVISVIHTFLQVLCRQGLILSGQVCFPKLALLSYENGAEEQAPQDLFFWAGWDRKGYTKAASAQTDLSLEPFCYQGCSTGTAVLVPPLLQWWEGSNRLTSFEDCGKNRSCHGFRSVWWKCTGADSEAPTEGLLTFSFFFF